MTIGREVNRDLLRHVVALLLEARFMSASTLPLFYHVQDFVGRRGEKVIFRQGKSVVWEVEPGSTKMRIGKDRSERGRARKAVKESSQFVAGRVRAFHINWRVAVDVRDRERLRSTVNRPGLDVSFGWLHREVPKALNLANRATCN